jgi:hypothetical protein
LLVLRKSLTNSFAIPFADPSAHPGGIAPDLLVYFHAGELELPLVTQPSFEPQGEPAALPGMLTS